MKDEGEEDREMEGKMNVFLPLLLFFIPLYMAVHMD